MVQPLLASKGFFMLILVLLLLSPASASVVSSENRREANKHIEIMNPFFFLAAGILAGFNPCLLAVMAFPGNYHPCTAGRKKGNAQNYFRFFNRDPYNTHICRNQYPQYCQLPA